MSLKYDEKCQEMTELEKTYVKSWLSRCAKSGEAWFCSPYGGPPANSRKDPNHWKDKDKNFNQTKPPKDESLRIVFASPVLDFRDYYVEKRQGQK